MISYQSINCEGKKFNNIDTQSRTYKTFFPSSMMSVPYLLLTSLSNLVKYLHERPEPARVEHLTVRSPLGLTRKYDTRLEKFSRDEHELILPLHW
jgi:hypothetical protein